jgi:hypothetical protein
VAGLAVAVLDGLGVALLDGLATALVTLHPTRIAAIRPRAVKSFMAGIYEIGLAISIRGAPVGCIHLGAGGR